MQKLVSGVYKIEDVATGSVYVGTADQANGIKKRWSNHSSRLKNNEYEYEELQEAYNDNPNRIKWEILADTSDMEFKDSKEENAYLEEMENYYINYCNLVDGWHVINKQKKAKRKSKVKDKSKMIEAQTGQNNGHCTKLTKKKVFEILDMLKDGVDRKVIAAKFNIYPAYTYRIGKDRWVKAFKEYIEQKETDTFGDVTVSTTTINANVGSISINLN